MPGMDGIELLKHLKRTNAALCVVVMTGHGDVPLAVEAMKLGAVDFVEKPFEDERLIDTVRIALAGVAGAANGDSASAQIIARVGSLSPRERQVMEGLVAGLSNKAIARDYDISPRTVEVYRANLMSQDASRKLIRTRPIGDAGRPSERLSWIKFGPLRGRYPFTVLCVSPPRRVGAAMMVNGEGVAGDNYFRR